MLITELPDTHVESLCSLFSTVFGVSMSPEMWRWKYHGTAQIDSINLVAYDDDDRLIAHAGAVILLGALDQGRSIPVAQVCDIMIAPSARGGIGRDEVYPKLMQAMKSSLASRYSDVYAFGFPGRRPFKLGERLGFYWRIGDITEYRLLARRSPWSLWTVDTMDWDDQHIERLELHAASMREAPAVIRNRAYLDWRYRQCPKKTYILLRIRKAFNCVGWAVVAGEGEVLRVIDSSFPGDKTASIVAALADWALRQGFSEIVTWLSVADAEIRDTGIVATEFGVQPPMGRYLPVFQPGDVDIF